MLSDGFHSSCRVLLESHPVNNLYNTNKMTIQKVSLSFAQLPDADLSDFTNTIITSLTNNASFTKPPVALAALTTQLDDFNAALAAAAQGGPQATATKNDARAVVVASLRALANYVQGAANDLPTLLSSGFQAVNRNTSSSPLDKPAVLAVENVASTQLLVRLSPISNARAYEVRVGYGPNGWQGAGVFTQARRVVLENLTPGTKYDIQARAVGGSTGYSDWSDPVAHMAL